MINLAPRSDPSALTAYENYEDRESEQPYRNRRLSEFDLYKVYREYMQHEDGLLTSRLSSFLTMNTFLIGASVVILGGIIQLLTRSDLQPQRGLILVTAGTIINIMIAVIGYRAAKLTQSSLMAATHSLAHMRDRGNYRLRSAISRGDLPYLTNGRGLSEKERAKLDTGSGIMRDIPRTMKWMWIIVGIIPLAIPIALAIGLDRCPTWDINPPPVHSYIGSFWRPALCGPKVTPPDSNPRIKSGSTIKIIN